jgi:hypothetical protein
MPGFIQVLKPELKEKFRVWLAQSGGIAIWKSIAGREFTPKGGESPDWHYELEEVITDLDRFLFVKEWKLRQKLPISVDLIGRKVNGKVVLLPIEERLCKPSKDRVAGWLKHTQYEHSYARVRYIDEKYALIEYPVFDMPEIPKHE